jgi:hypothetical protein
VIIHIAIVLSNLFFSIQMVSPTNVRQFDLEQSKSYQSYLNEISMVVLFALNTQDLMEFPSCGSSLLSSASYNSHLFSRFSVVKE